MKSGVMRLYVNGVKLADFIYLSVKERRERLKEWCIEYGVFEIQIKPDVVA